MSGVRTLKPGTLATDRKVMSVALAAVPTAAPSNVAGKGLNLCQGDFLHVYAAMSGGANAATVTPWYYSSIAEAWFKGNSLAFTTTTLIALIEIRGEDQVLFTVDALNAGTIDLWAGYSYEYREGH